MGEVEEEGCDGDVCGRDGFKWKGERDKRLKGGREGKRLCIKVEEGSGNGFVVMWKGGICEWMSKEGERRVWKSVYQEGIE